MGKKKRKFIDKRNDNLFTFKVVPRSQKDPLVADESAPQGVLIEAVSKKEQEKEELHKYGIYFDDDYDYLQHIRGVGEEIDYNNCDLEVYTIRKEDTKKKKGSKKEPGLLLPSSAFESYVEEPIGLLNRAASVADLDSDVDSDIAAALNSDEEAEMFDPEDEEAIPDNFVTLLNADDVIEEEEEGIDYDNDDDGDADDDYSFPESKEDKDDRFIENGEIQKWILETKHYDNSHPSSQNDYHNMPPLESSDDEYYDAQSELNGNYDDKDFYDEDSDDEDSEAEEERDELRSLPSANRKERIATRKLEETNNNNNYPPHRTELQKILDAKFETFYEREYCDDEIDLDPDLIRGSLDVDHPVFLQAAAATKRQFAKLKLDAFEGDDKDRTVQWVKTNMELRNYTQGEKEEFVDIEVERKPKYDIQSFHNARAKRQPVRLKTIDLDKLLPNRKPKLTMKAVKQHNRIYREDEEETSSESESEDLAPTLKSQISILSERPKGETPEDRRERKHQLKLLKRSRRQEKKVNKLLYKDVNMAQKNAVHHRVINLNNLY